MGGHLTAFVAQSGRGEPEGLVPPGPLRGDMKRRQVYGCTPAASGGVPSFQWDWIWSM